MTEHKPNAIFVFDIDGTIVPHGNINYGWDGKKDLIAAMKDEIKKGNQIWVSTANTVYDDKEKLMAFFKDTEIGDAEIEFMNPQIMKGIMDKRTDTNAQPPSSDFDGNPNDNIHLKGLKPFAIRELANQKFTPDKSADIKIYLFDDTPNQKDLTANSEKCNIIFNYVKSFEKDKPNDLLVDFNRARASVTVKKDVDSAKVNETTDVKVEPAAPAPNDPIILNAADGSSNPTTAKQISPIIVEDPKDPIVPVAPKDSIVPVVPSAVQAALTPTEVPVVPIAVPEVPVIVSNEEVSLSPFKFESETGEKDIWAFYRCLMRGFLLATYEQELETINANPSANKDDNDNNKLILLGQIGRLLRGMDKSILHIDNVFQFDEFAITECDLIVGMLTRISRWFKHKVQLDVPRQYFRSIDTSKIALESSADYFVHQVDLAFKDLKHKVRDPTKPPIVVKDIEEFIDYLADDMNNVGRSKVLATYDAIKGLVTAEKARALANNVTRKVRIVIDKTKQAGNKAVERAKKFTRGKYVSYYEQKAKRQREKAERADQDLAAVIAKQPPVQSGGMLDALNALAVLRSSSSSSSPSSSSSSSSSAISVPAASSRKGLDLFYPLKQYRELHATGEIEVMQKPNMSAVEYFEKLPVMLTRTGNMGNDQVFPALFGHPLLLYLPFARAFGCVIEVYSRSPEAELKLKYLFPSKSEIAKSTVSMPIIRIMDDNPYNTDDPNLKEVLAYPNFLTHQDQYVANFSLFLPSGGSEITDKAVKYLANKVKLSSQMQANSDKLQQFEDQYNIADAKYKNAETLMAKTKQAKENARDAYKIAKEKYDKDKKDKGAGTLPPTADSKAQQSAQKDNRTEFIKTRKLFTKEWEVYNTAIKARNAAFARLLVTKNRMNDVASKINSEKSEHDGKADAARQEVIATLDKYKVPTPFVKQTKQVIVKPVIGAPSTVGTAASIVAVESAPANAVAAPATTLAAAPVTTAPAPAPVTAAPVTAAPAPAPVTAAPAPAPVTAPVTAAPGTAPAPSKTVAAAPAAPVKVAPTKSPVAVAAAAAVKQSNQLKIMTFNVCWEALAADNPNPPNFTKHCMVNGLNQCKTNIRDAILDRMTTGDTVIFLQEFSSRFDDFFDKKGTISDSSGNQSKIFTYTLNAPSSKKFHVYSATPCSETITTICPIDIFPNRADRCFMGNLMGSPFTNSYDSNKPGDGNLKVTWTLMSGCRPYIVLVFNAQRMILINVHSNHNSPFSQGGTKSYTPAESAEMDRLNKQYGNMQQYAFTELKTMLQKEIPNEFKTYHIIIGGDFNSVTEARSKEMLGFLGMNVATVNTNNTLNHSAPTCSSNDMTQYTSVDDHIYSSDLKVVEYSVHPVASVKKDGSGKFLFSDHLPVYATIEMP